MPYCVSPSPSSGEFASEPVVRRYTLQSASQPSGHTRYRLHGSAEADLSWRHGLHSSLCTSRERAIRMVTHFGCNRRAQPVAKARLALATSRDHCSEIAKPPDSLSLHDPTPVRLEALPPFELMNSGASSLVLRNALASVSPNQFLCQIWHSAVNIKSLDLCRDQCSGRG